MKRILSLCLALLLMLALVGCTSEKSLYGTWYNDADGTRNAIQLSKNDEGKSVYIWAIYDIENDEITSQTAGYYTVTGSEISFKSKDGGEALVLSFELSGSTLRVYNDTSSLTLTKYELDSQE